MDQAGRVGNLQTAQEYQDHTDILLRDKIMVIKSVDDLKPNIENVDIPLQPLHHVPCGMEMLALEFLVDLFEDGS